MNIREWFGRFWEVLSKAAAGYARDHASHLAAAMAFYALFAVAPLVLIATAVGGLVWGPEVARTQLLTQIEVAVGPDAGEYVGRLLENWQDTGSGRVATLVGSATSLYLAFRVFDALRDMLNTVWGVRIGEETSWSALLWCYARSAATMLLVAPLFLISTLLSEVFTRLGPVLERWAGTSLNFGTSTFLGTGFLLLTGMFGIVYKWLPDVHIHWRDVWFGALVTALLFSGGRALIALYMTYATTASLFGAAGSLVVLLFWIYYSAQILFFGAELTQVYAVDFGRGIEPTGGAVRLTVAKRAADGSGSGADSGGGEGAEDFE